MKEDLRTRVSDELRYLLEEAMDHSISGLSNVFSTTPESYNVKEKLLKSKANSMERLLDNIDLDLISEDDAKKEFMRIMYNEK